MKGQQPTTRITSLEQNIKQTNFESEIWLSFVLFGTYISPIELLVSTDSTADDPEYHEE